MPRVRACGLLISLVVAGGLLPSAAASARQGYCSPSGDYCTSVALQDGVRTLWLGTFSFTGKASFCVTPPRGPVECVRKPLTVGDGGLYVAQVEWRKAFRSHRRGVYGVRFYAPGRVRLGPLLSFRV